MIGIRRTFKKMLRSYRTWAVRKKARSCGGILRVGGPVALNDNTFLGNNVNFNGLRIEGRGKVTIGDNFHSGTECLFITQIHNYDTGKAIPYDSTYILKDIHIEENVWLGSRVIILGGVRIGEGAIIQAGSCVVSDIPRCAIAGGHPAKVFKYRDIEHYEHLKKEGKFH
ncbi:acyltransferase [bacterium]|nr:acyltransferase [bacterium]MBV6480893.1 2,3,4,5-tetrahydropyridine-2,6-dicarboxylate N-acetyltransferase [bacterium]MCE7907363.1 acyltransferase [Candidatus Omnitrophica bacterium COP1]MCK6495605.1 acyltransferase [bacterium]NUP91558.1 acyltransferase [Candidatus Omnitrophota bacterium]